MISDLELQTLNVIRKALVGTQISSTFGGQSGRDAENLLEGMGFKIDRKGILDMQAYNWEVKTRRVNATSAQTVATMYVDDIISTPYRLSKVYEKIRKQLRFTQTEDNVISSIDLIDFDQPHIQHRLESAYESQRAKLKANPFLSYTKVDAGQCAYFEDVHNNNTLDFRITDSIMNSLIASSKSTYSTLFEEE